jgi:hypothetical protein
MTQRQSGESRDSATKQIGRKRMVELFNAELLRRDGFAAKFRRSTGRSSPPMKTFLVILLGLCGAIVLVVPASSSGETATALRTPGELDELLAPGALGRFGHHDVPGQPAGQRLSV